jgi:hypothetical protein
MDKRRKRLGRLLSADALRAPPSRRAPHAPPRTRHPRPLRSTSRASAARRGGSVHRPSLARSRTNVRTDALGAAAERNGTGHLAYCGPPASVRCSKVEWAASEGALTLSALCAKAAAILEQHRGGCGSAIRSSWEVLAARRGDSGRVWRMRVAVFPARPAPNRR